MFFVDWSNAVQKNTCRIIVYAAMWAWSFSDLYHFVKNKKRGNSSEKPSSVELATAGLERRQQPTIDNSAEAPHAERVPLSAQKKRPK